eukprot:6322079-Prorocentrum_lima.AAC.1
MANWWEDYIQRLDFGIIVDAKLEPRTVHTVLKDVVDPVASKDEFLRKAMLNELSQPRLRNPQGLEIVSVFARIMLGDQSESRWRDDNQGFTR